MCLKQIVKPNQLVPEIYYFNGNRYIALSLDSDFQLPPFSAYFMKASSSCHVRIRPPVVASSAGYMPSGKPVTGMPEPGFRSAVLPTPLPNTSSLYQLKGKNLSVNNPGKPGEVIICTVAGTTVFRKEIPSGNSFFSLPLSRGIYILSIQAGKERAYDKFVLYE
ncbi:MAG: T9SS type A sorting domain-containing protein [Tannerellaceae bacterium]|nr:T9SS type A sorting domain-containing protein [Tannerellaceae bacterium]